MDSIAPTPTQYQHPTTTANSKDEGRLVVDVQAMKKKMRIVKKAVNQHYR